MKGYLLMMNNLKKYVNKDGLWNQLIDQPDFWTETSGSAMFTYAMILGVQNGWLDKEEFAPIARRAWLGLCNYIDDKMILPKFVSERERKTVSNIIWTVLVLQGITMDKHR